MSTALAPETAFDEQRAEAFSARMLDIVSNGFISVMASVGHRTGLFDVLAGLPPATSEAIAAATGLQERYVREWLAAMVVGRIVDYDREAKTYWLPPEHANVLTRAAGPDNLAFFAQYVTLVGTVEDGIVDCFRNGGGLSYDAFPKFQQIQAEETTSLYDAMLVERMLPLTGFIARLRAGIAVADVGTGAGHAMNVMARAFPASSFTGYDFSPEGIGMARAEARSLGLENVRFEVKDVATIDAENAYDLVTAFDSIHDQAAPREVLARIARSLRPDGVFFMVDIAAASELADNLDNPLAPIFYSLSCMHCMTVSLAAGGEGLGAMWGREKATALLREAGFTGIEIRQLAGDAIHDYYIARKS